jgi:hypothetical protein
MNAEVQILNSQASTVEEEIKRKTQRLDQIIALRGQQENRIDNLISKSTTGSNTTIRSAQNQLSELNRTATQLQQEINKASAQRDSLKAKSLTTDVAISTNSDIGTFVYISRAIGVELDTVVKWFILVIVLVFDPLSICLVLAYNFLIKRENTLNESKEEVKIEEPKEEIKTFAVYDEKPQNNTNVVVRPWEEDTNPTQELLDKLNTNDPFTQYMTKAETDQVLEEWWKRRNGIK